MRALQNAPTWLPGIVALLERRPELAEIGYAPMVREVSA